MGASMQDIHNVSITIQDCRACENWPNIEPLLHELFQKASLYNEARHSIMEPANLVQSGEFSLREHNLPLILKKVEVCLGKLQKKGAHFICLRDLDIFCDAFVQAMIKEFGEATLGVAVY